VSSIILELLKETFCLSTSPFSSKHLPKFIDTKENKNFLEKTSIAKKKIKVQ